MLPEHPTSPQILLIPARCVLQWKFLNDAAIWCDILSFRARSLALRRKQRCVTQLLLIPFNYD